ncbi:GNAT family N-acetyltransferase [Pseudoroseicyclus aestuarii]|uniref:RimJ/RimL family protein N-acetyltransferase n=1 Tax=Pseudoroseicyclus aestuarii TaxID=1795041 RepID=A0A318SMT1_9RHOB|nr:GNAT family N-acetyltransferase [Pseudoroseicyclus aestuarii]PYE81370.1 RimJ/RimL family protein N-acetyltransferase [Pseudoroseicyclus aestuarii]
MSPSTSAEPVLETLRLTLRPARAEDLQPLHAILSDARAMRHWSTPPHRDLDETQEWLERMMDRPQGHDFVIEKDGAVIGKAGAHRPPEVGFILHPDEWGQGLGREAMEAVVPHLFATTSWPRLTAEADPHNAVSVGLLTRLGFAVTGFSRDTYRIDGQWSDSVFMTLHRPE